MKEQNRATGPSVIYSIEAEQGVLGCILLSPKESLSLLGSKIKGNENLVNIFNEERHKKLVELIVEMNEAGEPIDDLTLTQKLNDRGLMEAVGGIAYVSTLRDAPPSSLNLGYYLNIVREKYLLRSLVKVCTELSAEVYSNTSDVEALMDRAEKEILQINSGWTNEPKMEMRDLIEKAVQYIQDRFNHKADLPGIETGFHQLNKMTSGFHGGEMIVLAARPSMGKTALGMNIAEHVAIDNEIPVGVFSLEMTSESLAMRMLCSYAKVSMNNVRSGDLTQEDFVNITSEAGKIASAPIYIDDTPGLSILNLKSRARRMMEKGIKLFVIDYLQLLTSSTQRANQNRQQEISDISQGIKGLAKELDVPIIVLSQLNRDMEKGTPRKPRLSDLRESGSIEQDADIVMMIYKPPDEGGGNQNLCEDVNIKLIIAKQRNGPTGEIDLIFSKRYTSFTGAPVVLTSDVKAS